MTDTSLAANTDRTLDNLETQVGGICYCGFQMNSIYLFIQIFQGWFTGTGQSYDCPVPVKQPRWIHVKKASTKALKHNKFDQSTYFVRCAGYDSQYLIVNATLKIYVVVNVTE